MSVDNPLLKILTSDDPAHELHCARLSGWLALNLPEVNALYGVPQNKEHHPEVDTGRHIELAMQQAAIFGAPAEVRFAVLTHDLGKGITPRNEWPAHVNHERTGIELVHNVCDRFNVPPEWRHLAVKVCEYHLHAHRAFIMQSKSVNRLIRTLGFEEDQQFMANFVLSCRCDATGRLGKFKIPYRQGNFLVGCTNELRKLPMDTDVPRPHDSRSLARYNERIEAIRAMRKMHDPNFTKRGKQ